MSANTPICVRMDTVLIWMAPISVNVTRDLDNHLMGKFVLVSRLIVSNICIG